MRWNFCPWCAHRIYQHNAEGCLHVDLRDVPCSDPQCGDSTWDHECDMRTERITCDCKHPHALLVCSS